LPVRRSPDLIGVRCVTRIEIRGTVVQLGLQRTNQPFHVVIEVVVIDPQRLPVEQRGYVIGQRVAGRQHGARDEYGNDLQIQANRRHDFGAGGIVGRVEAPSAISPWFEPASANQDHGDAARAERFLDDRGPSRADADSGDVHEDAAGEPVVETVVHPAGVAGRIVPSVTDEDFVCGQWAAPLRAAAEVRWWRDRREKSTLWP
jgi:hypothetical protein